MPVVTIVETERIRVPITSANAGSKVTLAYCNPTKYLAKHGLIGKNVAVTAYIRELWAFTQVPSLPEMKLPIFYDEDDETTRTIKALNARWKSARYHLDVWEGGIGLNWIKVGTIALNNTGGYEFEKFRLFDYLAEGLSVDLGEGDRIGVSITDAGNGFLKSNDIVNIHGNIRYELSLYEDDMRITNPSNGAVTYATSETATTPTIGTTASELLAQDSTRKGWTLFNNSTGGQAVVLKLGTGDAVVTGKYRIEAGGYATGEDWSRAIRISAIATAGGGTYDLRVYS